MHHIFQIFKIFFNLLAMFLDPFSFECFAFTQNVFVFYPLYRKCSKFSMHITVNIKNIGSNFPELDLFLYQFYLISYTYQFYYD